MAWFFTKAALLTFGGAYAVLPYVYQGAVENYQWLTAGADDRRAGARRDDARARSSWWCPSSASWAAGRKAIFGPESLFLSGAVAAAVVTFFTFLPSFFFILLGAPFIESTHGNLKFTAPLTAITAAVVGVIVNLAVFFAYHVLWPQGLAGRSSGRRRSSVLAAAALFRFKLGVIPVIAGLRRAGAGLAPASLRLTS